MNAAAATLFDNPAVARPKQALTASQRDALSAAAFYRVHRQHRNGDWSFGRKRVRAKTIEALEAAKLVRISTYGGRHIALTMSGKLVMDKIREGQE